MFKKISRRTCLRLYSKFPTANNYHNKFFYPDTVAGYILTIPAKSLKGNIKNLASEFVKFMKLLGLKELIFLGDSTTEWLYRQNEYDDYKPAKDAFDYLIVNKLSKSFNGGIVVSITELPIFFNHLFWLTRSNAVIPYVHFVNEQQTFVGSICQYGNIHLSVLDEEADNILQGFLKESLFSELEDQYCSNQFSKSSAIKGRKIIV